MTSIRPARSTDLSALLAMGLLMTREAPWLSEDEVDEDLLREHLEAVVSGGGGYYPLGATALIYEDTKPQGAILGVIAPEQPWIVPLCVHELALWVRPEARRRGVGRQLIRALEAWGYDRGCDGARMGAGSGVLHEKTVALYESEGYSLCGQTLRKDLR